MSSPPSRRELQALETKRAILDAALKLFNEHGYGTTSVADIAAAAGVALPTVYASVGTKPQLLRLLLDRMEDDAGIAERVQRLQSASTAAEVVMAQIAITRALVERCGDIVNALRSAAGVEPELATAYEEGMQRHRRGVEASIDKVSALRGLRGGVDRQHAVAVLATLTAPVTWESLTHEHGWTFDEAERWLTATLTQLLLGRAR